MEAKSQPITTVSALSLGLLLLWHNNSYGRPSEDKTRDRRIHSPIMSVTPRVRWPAEPSEVSILVYSHPMRFMFTVLP